MAHILHWKQTFPRTRSGVIGRIGAAMRVATCEHRLALQAATKAASPRQSLAEVRTMYVRMCESQQENDVVVPNTKVRG